MRHYILTFVLRILPKLKRLSSLLLILPEDWREETAQDTPLYFMREGRFWYQNLLEVITENMKNHRSVSVMNINWVQKNFTFQIQQYFKKQYVTKLVYPRNECKEYLLLGNPQMLFAKLIIKEEPYDHFHRFRKNIW